MLIGGVITNIRPAVLELAAGWSFDIGLSNEVFTWVYRDYGAMLGLPWLADNNGFVDEAIRGLQVIYRPEL